MASNEDARAAREAKLDELHEKLTGAVESLVSGDDWRQALAFAARFRSRSFNNTMLIWVQHKAAFEAGRVPEPFPTLVAGYRQWQGLGRQVMKGQPGYMIFAPVTAKFASSNPADPARKFTCPTSNRGTSCSAAMSRPRATIAANQTIGRVTSGKWRVADGERSGSRKGRKVDSLLASLSSLASFA